MPHKIINTSIFFFRICYSICVLLTSVHLSAQTHREKIDFQKVSGQLAETSITKILEDSRGFLWIGTENGILKYDGSSFKKFDKNIDKKFVNGFVRDIYEDDSGKIYIATYRGINIYDDKLNELRRYEFVGQGKVLNKADINTIIVVDEYLWIGTSRHGLFKINIHTGDTERLFYETDNIDYKDVLHISRYGDNHYIIVNRNEVFIIDNFLNIKRQFKVDHIKAVKKIAFNKFLLGSFTGYYSELEIGSDLRIKQKNKRRVTNYRISSIEEDAVGNIWIASENDGLFIYNKIDNNITHLKNTIEEPNIIPNNSIWSIYKASNGVMWFGSFKKGLSFYDEQFAKFGHEKTKMPLKFSLSNNIVTSFLEDEKNNLWIGTDGGGLNYWDRESNVYNSYSLNNGKLNTNVVLSIIKVDEKLWLATWADGITVFDLKTQNYTVFNEKNSFLSSNFVQYLFKDSQGNILAGTFRGGLQIYNEGKNIFENVKLEYNDFVLNPQQVKTILEDSSGRLWIGTYSHGVIGLGYSDGIWKVTKHYKTNFKDQSLITNDYINVIYEDLEKNLWVGTDFGLVRYDPFEDRFFKILISKDLTNISVESIESDNKGNLWLGTNKGLKRYHPNTGKLVSYFKSDGVQGSNFNPCASYKTKQGELVFGGGNGFNIFYPEKIVKRKDSPDLYISKLKIQNKEVRPNDEFDVLSADISRTDTLRFKYTHNVINFEFTTITYRNPENVNYAYFLEGFDDKWNFVGNKNDVTYTNLSHGKYTLHIKSTNSDGLWVDNEKILFFEVVPPIWKTVWFRLVMLVLIILSVYLIYYSRVKAIKKNQKNLKKQIADRTRELQLQKDKLMVVADELSFKNEEIQRFAFSVSHDLKSPLGNIKTISELIQLEFSEKEMPMINNYMEMIDISCETMNDLIADITRVAKIGQIKNNKEILDTNRIVGLSKTMIFAKFEENNVELIIKESLPRIYADRNRIIQVFSNLFDNSIKYMGNQKTPIIKVGFEETTDKITFYISDNGAGIKSEFLPNLFSPFERFHPGTKGTGLGLYMIKQIIESHGGTISATSKGVGRGATFIISLPKELSFL